jgi:hypothetical protein
MLTRKPSEDAQPLLDLISIGQLKRVGAAAAGSVVAGEQSKTGANVSDVAAGGGDDAPTTMRRSRWSCTLGVLLIGTSIMACGGGSGNAVPAPPQTFACAVHEASSSY